MDGSFDDEAEPDVLSIREYLDDIEEEELAADVILGGDDGKECTYSKGYMKRQAIFSCLTCTPDGNAGVCTACSLSCHDGHQIVELWTRRNFRCDCGNSKFGTFYCKIFAGKDTENAENSYNHNFKGLYCLCARPYPDPDVEEQVDMIQCIRCEDWFHANHLGLESYDEILRDNEGLWREFMCKACSEVCFFLNLYPEAILGASGKQVDATVKVSTDKGVEEDMLSTHVSEQPMDDASSSHNSPKTDDAKATVSESISGGKDLIQGGNCANSKHLSQCTSSIDMHVKCLLDVNIAAASPFSNGKPMFLSKNWRDILCKCSTCLEFYNQKRITLLLDKEDSIWEYEKMGNQKREEKLQEAEGAEASLFNRLGHVEKVEILNGIEEMKDGFRTFLESADSSKPITITVADVHQIFEDMRKKRRRRRVE